MADQQQPASAAAASAPFVYTRENVQGLIYDNLYDAKLLETLEAWVELQAADLASSYDFAANRHLLQLYKFYPETAKPEVVAKVLLLALTQLPEAHFLACSYMIMQGVSQAEPVNTVYALAALLETAKFPEFWALRAENSDLVQQVPGFDEAIRKFAITTVGRLYKSMTLAELASFLDLDEAKTAAFVQAQPQELVELAEDGKTVRWGADAAPVLIQQKRERATVEQFSKILGLALQQRSERV